jgi:hypothetical protein
MANYDWRVSVPASGEQRGHTFFVAVRPHTAMFLRAVSKWYEVVVFTASMQVLQSEVAYRAKTQGGGEGRCHRGGGLGVRARAVHGGRAPEHFRALAAAQLAVSLRDPFTLASEPETCVAWQHYADPVIDLIDADQRVSRRFFRSACKLQVPPSLASLP